MYALILAASFLSPYSTPDTQTESKQSVAQSSHKNYFEKKTPPEKPQMKGYYIGGFGGMGRSNGFQISQNGAVFFPIESGGPLPVAAKGDADVDTYGYGGAHVGYEWLRPSQSGSYFMRGAEIEGYYVSSEKAAILNNPTERLLEHTFKDTFPLRMGVLLANGLLVWKNKSIVSPYIGIGIGAAMLHIHDADASQMDPVETGVNHFNSDQSDTDWVFATQAKAGLRFDFFKHMRLFAEYRFLYLTSSDYTFGSTKYPFHAATTKWKVHFDGICNNMWAIGIDFPW